MFSPNVVFHRSGGPDTPVRESRGPRGRPFIAASEVHLKHKLNLTHEQEREEMEKGFETIKRVSGRAPRGWREVSAPSPAWWV